MTLFTGDANIDFAYTDLLVFGDQYTNFLYPDSSSPCALVSVVLGYWSMLHRLLVCWFQLFWATGACFIVSLCIGFSCSGLLEHASSSPCALVSVVLGYWSMLHRLLVRWFQLFWATGACFIVFVSIFVMPTLGWRYLLFIGALPLFFFMLACLVSRPTNLR